MDPQYPGQLPDPQNQQQSQSPQPSPQAEQPVQAGQYDFITNPAKPKKGMFSFGKGNKTGLLVIVACGLGLFTLLILVGGLLFSGDSNKDTLLNVAQKQSEVIAVAQLGADDAGTAQAQALALAVQLAVTTEQQAVVAQINKTDEVKEKDYRAEPSSQVTTDLETAQRNGRFDEVFSNVIRQELTEYQQELRTANNVVSGDTAKTLLAGNFDNASLLLSINSN